MPPKRPAPTAAAKPASKKSRASARSSNNTDSADSRDTTEDAAQPPNATLVKKSNRWSSPSASANIDAEYRKIAADHTKAYKYVCICELPFDDGGDDDDDDDEEEDDDDEEDNEEEEGQKEKKKPCDGGKSCMCDKPAADHPEHPWKLTVAGKRKFFVQNVMCSLRNPDSFGMYTFNDHFAYGVLEVVQNMVLDYEEAADNWREQWAVCEAMGYFLHSDLGGTMTMIDDGDQANVFLLLIGRLFLSMLATLEREKMLAEDSEVINLGHIMTLYMALPNMMHPYGLLEESKKEALGPAKDKKKWFPHEFDRYVLAYARKYDVELTGKPEKDLEELIEEVEGDELAALPTPEANSSAKADVFGFEKNLKAYKKNYGGAGGFPLGKASKVPIGGDCLDITTWTSAERKAKAFDKKDPLGKKERDAIKEGLIMHPA
ncbi:hypothetical protein QBC44DRAFT_376032 [Cladorrhinum sp. PSN332]|nr:hypothetical protein QBC44DRAFT_376032 [Cladorrhinum sp. PSN332]